MAPTYSATYEGPTYSASTGPNYSAPTGPTYSASYFGEPVYGWGTPGNDFVVLPNVNNAYSASNGDDTVFGGTLADVLGGGEGNDQLYGGDGNDTLYGGNGSDVLSGGHGNDVMWGEAGSDNFQHSAGNDTMLGGADTDVFYFGQGKDLAFGGSGNDWFIMETSAVRGIGKFNLGQIDGGEGTFDMLDIWGTVDLATVKVAKTVGGPMTVEWKNGVNTYSVDVMNVEKIDVNDQLYDIGQFII